jgi:hypothetical protein
MSSTGKTQEKRFYVAHARGPDFNQLRKLGFVHFYPILDDYVFLEVCDENKRYLTKQSELGIHFVKDHDDRMTISAAELDEMTRTTRSTIQPDTSVSVIIGYCEGLEGIVKQIEGDQVMCTLQGYNREYHVTLNISDVVVLGTNILPTAPEVELAFA